MMLVDTVKQSPGATGIGAVLGAIATVLVAFITPMMTGWNFQRNFAIEAIKGSKSAEDIEKRLTILCSRDFLDGDKRCPPKQNPPKPPAGSPGG